jgi:ribosomal-protein-alanine N-acetyltransferase
METTRLILREYNQNDLMAVHEYCLDPEVLKYMLWGPNSLKETQQFIEMAITESTQVPRSFYNLAIQEKTTGKLIGGISLSHHQGEGEIGWILNTMSWKQGYGTEAAQAMIRFGFESLNLDHINATCDAENTGSSRVMEKCGMIQIEVQKQTRLSSYFQTMRDQRLFEITRAAYHFNHTHTKKSL